MGARQPQRKQLLANITNIDPIKTDQFIEWPPVDETEGMKPKDSRHGFAVLHFRQPGVRDAIFRIAPAVSNFLATPGHFARGQTHAQALSLEPSSSFRARC